LITQLQKLNPGVVDYQQDATKSDTMTEPAPSNRFLEGFLEQFVSLMPMTATCKP